MATSAWADSINVKSTSDSHFCWITGMAVFPNNRLLVADFSKNCNVKLVYMYNNTCLCDLKVPSQPWDVTSTNKDKAAVTIPVSEKILLLSVTDTLQIEGEIAVGGQCRGVAYSRETLVVSFVDKHNPRVEIIDLCGNVIRVLTNDKDGCKLFSWPQYVCVSTDGATVYVSDLGCAKVTSLTMDGGVNAVYQSKELAGPEGVCYSNDGSVYVCTCWRKTVLEINADLTDGAAILTEADGMKYSPYSLGICEETNQLLIAMLYDNSIRVYNLSCRRPALFKDITC